MLPITDSKSQTTEERLQEAIAQFVYDPLGFVYFAYPWGEPGPLEDEEGPDTWQIEVLEDIRRALESGDLPSIREAVASGHGVGKSTLAAWVIHWFVSTRPHPQCVITANTKTQLSTKTWRELAKWHKMAINAHWFKWTATKYYHVEHPETWFASAIPWTKDRPEAFAGTHERYVLMIFDEASIIEDIIWETAEGAMTTPDTIWLAFGNPTRNEGRFKEIFPGGRFAHRWQTRQVDSRNAKKADQRQNKEWIDDYGEDSDFVRIRVKGMFPRTSATQFIGDDLIARAHARFADEIERIDPTLPKVLGVDVARFGDDRTVFILRQGPRILWKRVYRELNTMQVSDLVSEAIREDEPDAVFVDVVGIGAGVVDRLHQIGHRRKVIGVNAGQVSGERSKHYNKRAEMWDKAKKWLEIWGELDPKADRELSAELKAPNYGYDVKERIQLERKEDMKKRGLASPDEADALCLTFAMPVARRPEPEPEHRLVEIGVGSYEGAWMG